MEQVSNSYETLTWSNVSLETLQRGGLAERGGDTTDCTVWGYYSCWPLQLCIQSFKAFYALPAKNTYAVTDFQS